MKITITFPDEKTATFTVNVKGKLTVEDIVDEILDEMLKRQIKSGQTIINPERWKEAHKRWLLPRVTMAIQERLEGFKIEEEEEEWTKEEEEEGED
jgi:hypothetical protein